MKYYLVDCSLDAATRRRLKWSSLLYREQITTMKMHAFLYLPSVKGTRESTWWKNASTESKKRGPHPLIAQSDKE